MPSRASTFRLKRGFALEVIELGFEGVRMPAGASAEEWLLLRAADRRPCAAGARNELPPKLPLPPLNDRSCMVYDDGVGRRALPSARSAGTRQLEAGQHSGQIRVRIR